MSKASLAIAAPTAPQPPYVVPAEDRGEGTAGGYQNPANRFSAPGGSGYCGFEASQLTLAVISEIPRRPLGAMRPHSHARETASPRLILQRKGSPRAIVVTEHKRAKSSS